MKNLYNIVKIEDPGIIAKSIVYIPGDEELTRERAQVAYENEKAVLEKLPSWWGLRYAGSFATDTDFINMTYEVSTCKWSTTRIPNPDSIAYQLTRQLKWLHDNQILHNDLELKNVMLSCDGTKAVLIDFEKSKVGVLVTPEDREREFQYLKAVLPPSVARYFPMKSRPRSMSAGKRRRTRRKIKA